MNTGKSLFNQIISLAPKYEFNKVVAKYGGSYYVKKFSCWDQLLCMIFAQMTHRESLRDIESCLRSSGSKQYHLGIRARVSRSTLAEANEKRDYRIFSEFGQLLMALVQSCYSKEPLDVDIAEVAYAFDSTNIDLCLSLFPWAQFDRTRAGLRITTSLALRGNIPCFIGITSMSESELVGMDSLLIEPGSIYIFDRGFFDWKRLHRFVSEGAFFLIRAKRDLKFKKRRSLLVNKALGIRADQLIVPFSLKSQLNYPGILRRISYVDLETDKRFVFLTNNLLYSPLTVASLYKSRWQIELFFKWVKQHLKIKSFFGTSPNAIKIQIWIAVITYLLLALAKKKFNLKPSLYTISQIISVNVFNKTSISQAFEDTSLENYANSDPQQSYQLNLLDF